MKYYICKLGQYYVDMILTLTNFMRFTITILLNAIFVIKRPQLIMKAIHFNGVKSIIIIAVSGWFVGMVLGLQGYNTLVRFGSVSMLGSVVALSLLKELGPVLTAILFAARAGSSMSAEIGLMRSTEQIDAMEVMAVNPIAYIIAPKFIASIICMPLLSSLFNTAGIFGGYFVGVILLKLDTGIFWSQMQDSVSLHNDIMDGFIKSIIFGIFVSLIALYQGYNAKPSAQGVALATTKTVVISALVVLALDYILTAII